MPMRRRKPSLRRSSASTASVVMCRRATRKTTTPQRTRDGVVVAPLAPGGAEGVEQLAVGQRGEQVLDGLQRGAVFEAVPGEERLGGVDDHHGERTPRVGRRGEEATTLYYATNPRSVGAVGEKSWEIGLCDAKCRENQAFLGERLLEQARDSRTLKHLRAEQPPQGNPPSPGAAPWRAKYDEGCFHPRDAAEASSWAGMSGAMTPE